MLDAQQLAKTNRNGHSPSIILHATQRPQIHFHAILRFIIFKSRSTLGQQIVENISVFNMF